MAGPIEECEVGFPVAIQYLGSKPYWAKIRNTSAKYEPKRLFLFKKGFCTDRKRKCGSFCINLRPSDEELKTAKATSVCLIDKFYPREAKVVWKADNKVVTSEVKNSDYIKDEDNTYSMSSMLTLSSEEYKKYGEIACEVTHKTLSSALVKSFKTAEC
ncbi:unnamed protein product [Ranitomeya imitator]|uniref:Ig-like domain-containing protein n=1 Tax=Ranitomeya imitator TaxID=111125 RepID=A0ABN9M245_9NEOB|nr:unnamed protein product [Ranitomeya imitator]